MNGIDILWALLTLLSVILFISGDCLAEVFQTLQNLGKMGYLFRMLTWTIQASFITLSLYRVWTRPWFASRRRGVRAMSVVFAVALMSCLTRLVL